MSLTKIDKLTAEQAALIPVYREKWREIALSGVDRPQATEAVKAGYAAIDFKEPEIIFCDSPYAACELILSKLSRQLDSQLLSQLGSCSSNELRNRLESQIRRQFKSLLGRQLRTKLNTQLKKQLKKQLKSQLNNKVRPLVGSQLSLSNGGEMWSKVRSQLLNQLESQLWNQLESQLKSNLSSLRKSIYSKCIQPEIWAYEGSWVDFCMSILNCECEPIKASALLSLVKCCGWIFPFEKICIVCSRPIKLSFDSENRLHAEGEPAIQFTDGYSLYSYQGVTLPERYGKLNPTFWQTQWLLEERNLEVGRVLAKGMGIYIESLTPEQKAYIPQYREKWRAIAFATAPINPASATFAVKAAYAARGLKEPEIIFYDSPYAALNGISSQSETQLGRKVIWQLESLQLSPELWSQVNRQLWHLLATPLPTLVRDYPDNQLHRQLENQVKIQLRGLLYCCFFTSKYYGDGTCYDFCISVLNCVYNQQKWEAFQLLLKHCGWIFPFEKTCIVCDRPIKLSFDNENRLHAEGEPAIQFADGYSLYSYHGVTLPEKYGKIHPHQWRSQWILEEDNAELRRVLIQGIGYARICQELQATELDKWQEYTLVKIDNKVDIEPISLLKMICPSTGFIHALRVPPDMKSAREAICWVNWGTNPEEFSVQT